MKDIKEYLISPFQKFVNVQGKAGFLLLFATVIALILANSPLKEMYEEIKQIPIGIKIYSFALYKPLIIWINDALMAVFFFLIGLEIKREIRVGELNTMSKATFPLFAAVGGMLMPALIFLILNANPETTSGWGVPIATDIAFSLAILSLLGKKVPISLKVFLTAFAIVDDLGAVLVVTFFYSSDIHVSYILWSLALLGSLYLLAWRGIYYKYLVFIIGMVVWYFFLKSGIHPTIAGVMLAFAIPVRQRISMKKYNIKLLETHKKIMHTSSTEKPILTEEEMHQIENLESWTKKVQSPLQHLERKYHGFVAYLVMPLFALGNAGVDFTRSVDLDYPLVFNIAAALFFGGCIGVTLFGWLSVKLGLASYPKGTNFGQFVGVAFLAGVGFTMSIFIANLAFWDSFILVESAKLGILIGSFLSGLTGYLIIRRYSTSEIEEEDNASLY